MTQTDPQPFTPPKPRPREADAVLSAAQRVDAQLERLSAWKHQLARQMELLRRDGIKLLERQKNAAQQKAELATAQAALAADRESLAASRQALAAQAQELDSRAAALAAAESDLTDLTARRAALEAELADAQAALDTRRAAVEVVAQTTADEQRGLADARTRLQSTTDELQAKNAQLTTTSAQLTTTTAQLDTTTAQLQTADGQLRATTANLDNLCAQFDSLTQEVTHAAARRDALQAELAALENAGRTATAALADARQALADAQSQHALALQQARETAGDAAALAQRAVQSAQLDARTEALERRATELAARDADLQARAAELATRDTALDARTTDLHTQSAAIASQAAELNLRSGDLDARAATLTSRAGDLQTRELALDARAGDLESDAARLDALAAQLDARNFALDSRTAQLDARHTDLARLAAELDHRQAAITEHEAAWLARDVALRDAAEQLETQRRELAHAQQELQHAAEEAARESARQADDFAARQAALQAEVAAVRDAAQTATRPDPLPDPVPAPADPHAAERQAALQRQVATLESQNESLLRTLSDLQAAAEQQTGEALLARNTLECELLSLRHELELLRGQRLAPVYEPPAATPAPAAQPPSNEAALALQTLTWHRDRLLQRALLLRQKRRRSRDAARALGSHFQDIARQRDELRAKKENLELVKRFLEKQEMVMARKLADHNALRTVAAVGIFLLMILGSSFAGIYTFLSPVYRTEAVIRTAPGNAEADIDGWLNRQAEFIKSPEVTSAAWRILRSPDNHYAMHDVREEWLNSFAKHLTIAPDDAARTLTIRYTGPAAEGVSQVANALASAYVNPNLREASESTHLVGAGATLDSPAPIPTTAAQDHRFTTSLAISASAVFLSLIAVMSFRHLVSRQLREIDAMADPTDLSELSDEVVLPADA